MSKIRPSEALMMNRHERRRLGKINGIKIPGVHKPLKNETNTTTTENTTPVLHFNEEDIAVEREVIGKIFKENEKEL